MSCSWELSSNPSHMPAAVLVWQLPQMIQGKCMWSRRACSTPWASVALSCLDPRCTSAEPPTAHGRMHPAPRAVGQLHGRSLGRARASCPCGGTGVRCCIRTARLSEALRSPHSNCGFSPMEHKASAQSSPHSVAAWQSPASKDPGGAAQAHPVDRAHRSLAWNMGWRR